jgi:hypothetical protein
MARLPTWRTTSADAAGSASTSISVYRCRGRRETASPPAIPAPRGRINLHIHAYSTAARCYPSVTMTTEEIKALLKLQPHPIEGGFFRRTYTSAATPSTCPAASARMGTAIYYLLEPGTFSEMHVLDSDEIFHFYLGDPVEMLQLHPDGRSAFYSWTGSGRRPACPTRRPRRRLARHAPHRRRQGRAARLHRNPRLRLRRLPQRKLCRVSLAKWPASRTHQGLTRS